MDEPSELTEKQRISIAGSVVIRKYWAWQNRAYQIAEILSTEDIQLSGDPDAVERALESIALYSFHREYLEVSRRPGMIDPAKIEQELRSMEARLGEKRDWPTPRSAVKPTEG